MIDVDGSLGEGGGQILRTAIALSSVLGKDVRVFNIRAGRSPPGIKAQHLAGVKAAAEICGASVEGARVGSAELLYRPGRPTSGNFRFDIGTAGSITLVLQTLMPVLAHAPGAVHLRLTGGTDVKWSPPVDYMQLVTLPILRLMGYESHLTVARRGHYPRGGGEVEFSSSPVPSLRVLVGSAPGKIIQIDGVSHAVGLPRHVAERQAEAAQELITGRGLPSPNITLNHSQPEPGMSPGSGLVLAATTEAGAILGADSRGERGRRAEEVGEDAGRRLVEEIQSRTFLDRHMGDMVVPFITLANGTSEVSVSRITQHTLTNVKVAELLAGIRFRIQGELEAPGVLRASGPGLRPSPGVSSPREATLSSHL